MADTFTSDSAKALTMEKAESFTCPERSLGIRTIWISPEFLQTGF